MDNHRILDFVERLKTAKDQVEASQLLIDEIAHYGYRTFVYAVLEVNHNNVVSEYLSINNLRPDFIDEYMRERMYEGDTLARDCATSTHPQFWEDFLDKAHQGLLGPDARRLAQFTNDWNESNGVTIPLPMQGPMAAGIRAC